MALTTLARLKLRLGLTDTSQDELLTMILEQIEAAIANMVTCVLSTPPVAATEFYDGNDARGLALRRWPVTAVSAVYVDASGAAGQDDDPFAAATLLDPEADYYLDIDQPDGIVSRSGLLMRRNCVWPGRAVKRGTLNAYRANGQANIKVTYTAGWTTIPADLELVCHRMCAIEFAQQFSAGPMTKESFEHGDYSYALAQGTEAQAQAGNTLSIIGSYNRPYYG